VRNTLVPLDQISQKAATAKPSGRNSADFIAHLIAAATKAPQTCGRRRASVQEATSLYGNVDRRVVAAGRSFSRSL